NYLYASSPTGLPPVLGEPCTQVQNQQRELQYEGSSHLLVQVPFNFGVHVGIGEFHDRATWRGVVLGAAWSPSISYLDCGGSFRYLGAEVTIDFVTLTGAVAKRAHESQLRIAVFFLPPSQSTDPILAMLSLGAVSY